METSMGHTYTNLLAHIIFSTKDRLPYLQGERRDDVFSRYISYQVEHHRKRIFQEELIALFKKSGMEYDERVSLEVTLSPLKGLIPPQHHNPRPAAVATIGIGAATV